MAFCISLNVHLLIIFEINTLNSNNLWTNGKLGKTIISNKTETEIDHKMITFKKTKDR